VIRWETRDSIGVATIDRPHRRNALDADHCRELRDHFEAAPDCRAVVVTGADGSFCAGADLGTRFGGESGEEQHGGDTFRPAFEEVLDAIVGYAAPVIAAIEGPALGAGMQLVVACDLRVASPGAKLGIPAGKLGVHLSAANIVRLGQVAGQGAAREILLGGVTLTGEQAAVRGLVHRLDPEPLTAALAWADELAALAPLTLAGHKRALNLLASAGGYGDAERAAVLESERAAFASDDLREGMAAFTEKRAPQFRGR
jgi:enoyl-CoA hydratase